MDRTLHFVLLLAILQFSIQEGIETGNCECGVFSKKIWGPIIERPIPYNVTCNGEGEEKCQQLCIAIGEASRENAPQMICANLNIHVDHLYVALYAKACNAINWKFAGLTNAAPICCHEGESTSCDEPVSLFTN